MLLLHFKGRDSDNYAFALENEAVFNNSNSINNNSTFSFIEKDDGVSIGKLIHYKTIPKFTVFGRHETQNMKTFNEICLFTQLSLDRIDNLIELASSWKHEISAAIYIKDATDSRLLYDQLEQTKTKFNARMGADSNSRVIISLLYSYEFNASPESMHHPYDFLYPINSLRNLALQECKSNNVFSLDADFVVSEDSYKILESVIESYEKLPGPFAFVLPAFEWINKVETMPQYLDMDQFRIYCSRGRIIPFHSKRFARSRYNPSDLEDWCHGKLTTPRHLRITRVHNQTNYAKWLQSDDAFIVDKNPNVLDAYFEPYFVGKKSQIPKYDERFRGYGFNKRENAIAMQYFDFQFVIVPNAFVVHRIHEPSTWKKSLKSNDVISNTLGRTFELYKREMISSKKRRKMNAF